MQAWIGLVISLCELLGSWEIMQELRRKQEEFLFLILEEFFSFLYHLLRNPCEIAAQRTRKKDLFCPMHALGLGTKVSVSIIP